MAEQVDMLVVDRGDAACEGADQTHRIVTAADAGFEHCELAIAFLEIHTGEREHRLEGPELFTLALRDFADPGFHPRNQPRQIVIADIGAINLKPSLHT